MFNAIKENMEDFAPIWFLFLILFLLVLCCFSVSLLQTIAVHYASCEDFKNVTREELPARCLSYYNQKDQNDND